MGLDQYLDAKTKILSDAKRTGACDGLFPLAPKQTGTAEIGYWRKVYSLSEYMWSVLDLDCDSNCVPVEVDYDTVCQVLEHAKEMIAYGDFEDEYEFEGWIDAKKSFEQAKWILENDNDAEIYYMEWW